MDLWEPRIVWLSGPHPAAKHDISVFRGANKDEDDEADLDRTALLWQLKDDELELKKSLLVRKTIHVSSRSSKVMPNLVERHHLAGQRHLTVSAAVFILAETRQRG